MGAAPSHGTTMGYVSDPFRTEEQNPTLKGSLSQPMVKPLGPGQTRQKTSRGESSRHDAISPLHEVSGYHLCDDTVGNSGERTIRSSTIGIVSPTR